MDIKIIYKSIREIVPYENNPRLNDEAIKPVANSIKQFGFKVPIIIDSNNVIIAGHTRLKAAKQLSVDIGYIPKGKVIGLSKISRIAQMCCKRLQLQERIGEDIAKVIQLATGSDNVIVKITANHSCVTARGIKSNSNTTTLTTKGIFNNAQNINSFFNTINM